MRLRKCLWAVCGRTLPGVGRVDVIAEALGTVALVCDVSGVDDRAPYRVVGVGGALGHLRVRVAPVRCGERLTLVEACPVAEGGETYQRSREQQSWVAATARSLTRNV